MELNVKNWALSMVGIASLMTGLPQSAQATGSRVWTLGVMNRFIEDDANRWLYPHTISKYGNLFYLELYGLSDSLTNAAVASSKRGGNDGLGMAGLTGLENNTSLTGNDLVPLQSTAGGGAILKLMDEVFVSMHLSDYENPIVKSFLEGPFSELAGGNPGMIGWIPSKAPPALSAANRKLDLSAAFIAIPDLLTVGLSLSLGSSSYVYNPNDNDAPLFEMTDDELARATDNIGTSETRLLASAGMDLSDSLSAEVSVGFGYHGLTYLPNNRSELILGGTGTDFQFDGRLMLGLTEWWELVPALSFRAGSFMAVDLANLGSGLVYNNVSSDRDQAYESDVELAWTSFDLGVAGHFKPLDHVDFWLATGIQVGSMDFKYVHLTEENPNGEPPVIRDHGLETFEESLSITVLPYFKTGLEAKVFSWLDLRVGVVKFVRSDKVSVFQEDKQEAKNLVNNDATQDRPFFDYFIGLAAHYEGFFLDMQLDPEWIRRGPNFLSGAQGNMFLNGSLGYNF